MNTSPPTEFKDTISRAESNLQRKLEWISRYDTRIIFISGVIIAMLGVLASASGKIEDWKMLEYIFFGLSFILLGISLICIYYSQNPKTLSPNKSLIFFGTISKMEKSDFVSKFKSLTDEAYLEDLLQQIHINAEILNKKFLNLKFSLLFLALSIIPWGVSIYLSKLYIH